MARPLRLEFPHAVYYVTSRGNARQKIVRRDEDRHAFLSALAQSKTIKYGLVYIPFMILIISISLNKILSNKKILF